MLTLSSIAILTQNNTYFSVTYAKVRKSIAYANFSAFNNPSLYAYFYHASSKSSLFMHFWENAKYFHCSHI